MNTCSCGCGKTISKKGVWARGHNPNKTKDRFNWSNLLRDFEVLGSVEAVSKKYGCSYQAVHFQLNKRGVDPVTQILPDDLFIEGYEELKSVNKLAERLATSSSNVFSRLKSLGYSLNHDNKGLDVDVGVGRYGERIALNLLEGSKDRNKNSIIANYDICWSGMKIDVKTSRFSRTSGYFSFNCRNDNCSHYLLLALGADLRPEKIFLIPRTEVGQRTLHIKRGRKSMWDGFELKFPEEEISEAVGRSTTKFVKESS